MLSGTRRVPAEEAVNQFSRLAVLGKAAGVLPRLRVEHDERGALADALVVAEAGALVGHVAAGHADPDAVFSAGFAGGAIVDVPHLEAPRVAPLDPLAVGRVAPVGLLRQVEAGGLAEAPARMDAVGDVVTVAARPAVVRKAVGVVALGDLLEHRGQVLAVVGAVDAGDVEAADHVGLALGIDGHPVRMFNEEGLVHPVGVHAGEHGQAVLPRRLHELAEEVAASQALGVPREREAARVIVGHDAARVQDHALGLRPAPVLAPEVDVIARGVDLR